MALTALGLLDDGDVAEATDVNPRGTVVGWSETTVDGGYFTRAVRWDDDTATELGALRADRRGDSEATGVNARGTVVGFAARGDRVRRAVRWVDDGPPEDLGALSASTDADSQAYDVNARGTVVGHSDAAGSEVRAFRWTEREGMEDLGTLRADGAGRSVATAVTDQGTVVGRSQTDDGSVHGFEWTERRGMEVLRPLPGDAAAGAFDADGPVVVGRSSPTDDLATRRAVAWIDGERYGLGTLHGGATRRCEAYGVAGDVAVGRCMVDGGVTHAFRWEDGRLEDLGTLLEEETGESRAAAVNRNGVVVGASQTPGGGYRAVRWDP